MAYSVYHGATDISDNVVGCDAIPLLEVTHDGQITLPTMSIEVIWDATAYAKDDVISFRIGATRFASFIIDEIVENYEGNTKTLNLVDQMMLLERYYVKDLTATDYGNAITGDEDVDGAINLRYYFSGSTMAPHRVNFVTVTYMLKTALVKAGLATAANIDMKDYYGEIESGFTYWDSTLEEAVPIFYEELAFHPNQVKWAKNSTSADAAWDGANLLEVALFCLYILNARVSYAGTGIKVTLRTIGTAPANDTRYAYSSRDWLNTFDLVKMTLDYLPTTGLSGFGTYVGGSFGSGSTWVNESWTAPATPATGKRLVEKSIGLMKHCVVHRRGFFTDHYEVRELEIEAIGETFVDDYMFANQFCNLVFGRYPTSGTIETFSEPANVALLGARKLLKHKIDVVDQVSTMEY